MSATLRISVTKKPIEIEKALQWAMCEELPKGRPVSVSPWDMITTFGQLGARVQTSGYGGDGLGFVPGSPHQDAEVIAAAVAKVDNDAHFADRAEVLGLFGEFAGIAGDAVDSILLASFNPRSLVIGRAIAGKRPPWQFECPTPYQMRIEFRDTMDRLQSRPRVVGTDAEGDIVDLKPRVGGAAQRHGMYDLAMSPRSPLQWSDPSLIHIGHARAEYLAWHDALVSLADRLAGALDEYEVLPPKAARMPWITGQTPDSRVLSDGFPAGLLTGKLALAPQRTAPGRPIESDIKLASRPRPAVLRAARARKRLFTGVT